ncbi:hydroxyacid dehydrogenase [candidate division WWE3 bacterium]|uniref:Hydroxyacid dehydrogenase n=1 Tax=candidate division WWE3 bacterium TaxID=2053526 RepID=A0A955LJG8_UNCKA|nr:hydroxyacid dehydrogenase [candidate division WWE3 bacterium]
MKILICDNTEDWQGDFLKANLKDHDVVLIPGEVTAEVAAQNSDCDVLSVFVTSKVTPDIINALPNLKYIATRSTGFDHVDLSVAKEKGINVSNVPFYGENTVAEHAFALLLSLSRKLPQSFARIEDGRFNYEGLRGFDLKDKTIGIIGGGHIGINMARMSVGFNMNVLVFDLKHDDALAAEIGFTYAEMDELLAKSDVVSLHLPLNPHTEHIINADSIAKMKDGALIINTARGGLIETDALVQALRDDKLGGAGLDVLEGEEFLTEEMELVGKPEYKEQLLTLLEDHILMEMENVVVTPHNAFNSIEAVTRILQATADNINAFAAGEPQNLVS